jgi:hypothetical protein
MHHLAFLFGGNTYDKFVLYFSLTISASILQNCSTIQSTLKGSGAGITILPISDSVDDSINGKDSVNCLSIFFT